MRVIIALLLLLISLTALRAVPVSGIVFNTLAGRVVTPDGKPVVAFEVMLSMRIPKGNGVFYGHVEQLITDARGHFSKEDIAQDAQVTITVAPRPGYQFLSGGEITNKDGVLQVADIVLKLLNAQLAGRVLTAAGMPAAGAVLLAPDSGQRVKAGADGGFLFTALADGELTVVAVQGTAAAVVKAATGEKPVTITLAAAQLAREHDVKRASRIITDAWQSTTALSASSRNALPWCLAAQDPDAALKLAQDEQGAVPEAVTAGIIDILASVDSARAAEWAPSHLAFIKDPHLHAETMLTLAMAVAGSAPDLAAELYRQAKGQLHGGNQAQVARDLARLAACAARLKHEEASALAAQAIAAAKSSEQASQVVLANTIYELAKGSPALAEGFADQLTGGSKLQAFGDIATAAAPCDIAVARRCLAKIEALPADAKIPLASSNEGMLVDKQEAFAGAAFNVIQSLGMHDPAAALALAHNITGETLHPPALALALMAQYQPKETALPLLRGAAEAFRGDMLNITYLGYIARLAYTFDPRTGAALYRQAKELFATMNEPMAANYKTSFAFYGSAIDPAESRLILETEFARMQKHPDSNSWSNDHLIPFAMAPLDIDRAVAMAQAIPDPETRLNTLVKITQYALASTEKRNELPFHYWGGLDADRWMPGTPVWW